ncbi:MAG: hypothetical protein AAF483_07025 [Planctomycetota bacterium]
MLARSLPNIESTEMTMQSKSRLLREAFQFILFLSSISLSNASLGQGQ